MTAEVFDLTMERARRATGQAPHVLPAEAAALKLWGGTTSAILPPRGTDCNGAGGAGGWTQLCIGDRIAVPDGREGHIVAFRQIRNAWYALIHLPDCRTVYPLTDLTVKGLPF